MVQRLVAGPIQVYDCALYGDAHLYIYIPLSLVLMAADSRDNCCIELKLCQSEIEWRRSIACCTLSVSPILTQTSNSLPADDTSATP